MHWFITSARFGFSRAAATLSLSASCLLTAASDACVPGVISTVTLNRGGKDRMSLTRIESPIKVAIEQCGIVGVKFMKILFSSSSTFIKFSWTTRSSSNVKGCSGSLMFLMRSAGYSCYSLHICKY